MQEGWTGRLDQASSQAANIRSTLSIVRVNTEEKDEIFHEISLRK